MIPIARLRVVWVTDFDEVPDDASLESEASHAARMGASAAWLRQPRWTTNQRLRAVDFLRRLGWSVIVGRDARAAAGADGMQCAFEGPFPDSPLPFGVSIHDPEEAPVAMARGASWLVAGPVRNTVKRGNLVPGRGFDWLARVTAASALPVVAVGGLGPDDVDAAVKAGAVGIAGISVFRRR